MNYTLTITFDAKDLRTAWFMAETMAEAGRKAIGKALATDATLWTKDKIAFTLDVK